MNVFVDVGLRARKGTDYLIDKLREFALQAPKWTFDEARSQEYLSGLMDTSGCILLLEDNEWSPVFAVCEETAGHCRLVNIVPKETGEIPHQEYNSLAREFYDDVREWSRRNRKGLRLSISKTDLELEDIISATIPRRLFLSFLNKLSAELPPARHPKARSLHLCSFEILSESGVHWEYLREYLLTKKGWPESNVEWCLKRIEIGLEIIEEYKQFH